MSFIHFFVFSFMVSLCSASLRQVVTQLNAEAQTLPAGYSYIPCTYYNMDQTTYTGSCITYNAQGNIGYLENLPDNFWLGMFVVFQDVNTGICYTTQIDCGNTLNNYCGISNGMISVVPCDASVVGNALLPLESWYPTCITKSSTFSCFYESSVIPSFYGIGWGIAARTFEVTSNLITSGASDTSCIEFYVDTNTNCPSNLLDPTSFDFSSI